MSLVDPGGRPIASPEEARRKLERAQEDMNLVLAIVTARKLNLNELGDLLVNLTINWMAEFPESGGIAQAWKIFQGQVSQHVPQLIAAKQAEEKLRSSPNLQ